jgi:integral membrane protein (TIGR01906 family)
VSRAPGPLSLLLGLSLALLILLAGPLLLFNPAFTSLLQDRHDVPEAFGVARSETDRVTTELLLDIYGDGDFEAALEGEQPLLNERERSHMHDVSVLVRILFAVVLLSAVLAGVAIAWLRHEPRRLGRVMLVAGGAIGLLAVLLAATFAVAFEPAFLAFHEIFFPPGTYLFERGSKLITLFPEGFWFDASLAAGGTILLGAVIVSVIGLRLWRGGERSTART